MLYGVNLARRQKIVKIARAFEVKPKNAWPRPNNAHFENRQAAKYADKIMHAREGQQSISNKFDSVVSCRLATVPLYRQKRKKTKSRSIVFIELLGRWPVAS
jgi:hypothetical protein